MIEKYAEIIGENELDAIFRIAEELKGISVLHINSTQKVAESQKFSVN